MSYRDSHAGAGQGACYRASLDQAYYAELWRSTEAPLVERIGTALAAGDPDALALDFACGTGRVTEILARSGAGVQCVDVSGEMLSIAERVLPATVRIQRGDVTRDEGLCPGPYTLVTAFRFFMNAEDDLRTAAMNAISRRQPVGGFLLLNVQCSGGSPLGVFHRVKARLGRATQRTMTVGEVQELLAEFSYTVISIRRYGLLPRPGSWNLPGLVWLMRAAEWVLRALPFMGVAAQCFIVLAIKGAGARRP